MSFIGLAQFYAFLIPRYTIRFHDILKLNSEAASLYAKERKERGKPLRLKPEVIAPPPEQEPLTIPTEGEDLPASGKRNRVDRAYTRFLTALTVQWNEKAKEQFYELRDELCSPGVMVPFDPYKPTVLETDASLLGLSAILHQLHGDNQWHMVSAYSRGLTPAESKKSVTVLEATAACFGLGRNQDLIEYTPITLVTDHQAIATFLKYSGNNRKLRRMSDELRQWSSTVNYHYRPGSKNVVADALSRLPAADPTAEDLRDYPSKKFPDPPSSAEFVNVEKKAKHHEVLDRQLAASLLALTVNEMDHIKARCVRLNGEGTRERRHSRTSNDEISTEG
jgi:hypothetical protein